ncbi:hypothetical protein [Chitinibacter sp. ZOR0017]|uniref:hypothetical protein n=1 Tax=Chitinibacter sp. ZOR0017 TaxID=1339254 RepID=UPI000648DC5F|nr:hypothetical protein [Chitinibacter sp. ZOR0017]
MSIQHTISCRITTLAVASAIAFSSMTAGAANNEFQYLTNNGIQNSHNALEGRGYQQVHSEINNNQNQVVWWNSQQKDCVVTNERFGKTTSVYDVSKSDCDPYIRKESGMSPMVGLLAGAAAIAGIAAIANHNKHKQEARDNEARNNEDYEQGYQDGLERYHRYGSHSDAYNNGYETARREREERTSSRYSNNYNNYHNDYNHHFGAPHESRYVKVADLYNLRASTGEQELINRGFHVIDGAKGWRSSSVLWVNEDAQECVSVTTKDGRFQMPAIVAMSQCA